ncbi:MAG: hypothetical protein DRM97_00285 [Thermoprotei archaeon]|nr:MAG: hypothetical protein DRM97_00285 [Thermoprotei archaeon]
MPEPKIIGERIEKCPYCHAKTLRITEVVHTIPYFGEVLIVTTKCECCGYKHTSVSSLGFKRPTRYVVEVEKEEDLNIRVIRSGTATIRIPELGILIEPGPIAQGEITNIEGVLTSVKELVEGLLQTAESEEERESCRRFLAQIERALKGELRFTFIIEDPLGSSALIAEDSGKVKTEPISSEELRRIKYGELALVD